MNFKILVNENITSEWFEKMLKMENRLFPPEGSDYLSPEYVRSLYQRSREGLFFAIDETNDRLVGYITVIFLDEQQKDYYLNGGHFSELKNIGMKKGKNIMYLYTIAVDEAYRGSSCMKEMGKALAKWLDEKEAAGFEATEIYAEAVSQEGAKSLKYGFEMEEMDTNSQGFGHYKSEDRLVKYRKKMLG